MHSTWLDNEQTSDNSKRIQSASKKGPTNRIQVVSKINPLPDRNNLPLNMQPVPTNLDYMNQTCVDRKSNVLLRRVNTTEGVVEKDQRERNLMKLMQEQLEFVRVAYEQKIKEQLKQSSIELSKLKIKIQNNNEMISSKDQIIEQLRDELRRASPMKQYDQPKLNQVNSVNSNITQKINDVQVKFVLLMENQNKLGIKMTDISSRVDLVEKGLLSILACKMANIQRKLNEFVQMTTGKLNNIQISTVNKIKKQISTQKSVPISGIEAIMQRLDGLRQQVYLLKNKDFRYENSSITTLRRDLTNAQNTMTELQRKLSIAQNMLRSSKCSSRKNQVFGSANNSCYFDDYEEVYQDADSVGDDQFFHPLQQSTRKFHSNTKQYNTSNQKSHNPSKYDKKQVAHSQFRSNSKPGTTHNDSFENFTSDEEQEQTPNQKRLRSTLQAGGYKLPLVIEIDLTGYIRKKSDHSYLLDCDKRVFMLNAIQLEQCRVKGWLVW